MSLTLRVEEDGDIDDRYFWFTFTYKNADGVSTEMDLDEPYIAPLSKWDDLRIGRDVCLCTCGSNGNVSIECKNGFVIFNVAKHGAGGGGTLNISIPFHLCVGALKDAYDYMSTKGYANK